MSLKLLCIVAHPDDECFAFGGALALAARQGVETHVICLTDGQAATHRGEAASGEELGRMRRQEFANSCRVLGVTTHELLDYQDGQLEHADFSAAAALLVARMRDLRPDVVLTFGPDGALNTHPDHAMVSCFTSTAFHWAGSPKRFPALGAPHKGERLFVLSTGFFMEGRPEPMPAPWTALLDVSGVLEQKQAAFREHTSQAPLMEQTRELFARYGQAEYYTLLAARQPGPAEQLTGLFEGL